jgi:glycosyltransferase involved in cell wall biosynthesis
MLHFFPHYADDVDGHPFAEALRDLGMPHRIFARRIDRTYRTRLGLFAVVYPRLAWFAAQDAVRSLIRSRPRPTAAIIGSVVEALVFGLLRRLLRLDTLIVFQSLIITPRRTLVARALSRGYFALVLRLIDLGICHSRSEREDYRARFPRARCRFAFVPYGTTVHDRATAAAVPEKTGVLVSAGRSGRDYRTLAAAIRGLDCRLRIICNVPAALDGVKADGQISILPDCFGWDYILALAEAQIVVVPLAAESVSAGQMVLLQARALGKPTIISRTRTTVDYATDEEDALLVGIGDMHAMRAAIVRLLTDARLRQRIGSNARRGFERENSTEAYIRNLVTAVESALARRITDRLAGQL